MSQVLRCKGLNHLCAFLIETGPAQTTPIPQTLMLFSVILLNCSWGSWAHKLPPCLSPLKAKNLYPLGCTVWECLTQETLCTGHSFCPMWVGGGHCVSVSPKKPSDQPQLLPHGGGKHYVSVSPKKHSAQATAPTPHEGGGEKGRGTVWECLTQETQWPGHSSNTNIVHWILGPMFSQEYQSNNHLAFTVIWGNRRGLKWFLLSYYLV